MRFGTMVAAGAAVAIFCAPVPVAATVMLRVAQAAPAAPCYSDSPACDRSVGAPLNASTPMNGLPDPAVAAIVGLAFLGLALTRRRTSLPQVVS